MAKVKRIVLDVLKPHHPSILEFGQTLANLNENYRVKITVTGVDEKTESIIIELTGKALHFEYIVEAIAAMGGSVHSIDEVEVDGGAIH